uniref:DDB1- and CUL4-associated factor 12 beta-propeller domain-containing protein n=1 Tax=Tetranychus urticae TaxID=32264 RepID=T1KRG3_TETUR
MSSIKVYLERVISKAMAQVKKVQIFGQSSQSRNSTASTAGFDDVSGGLTDEADEDLQQDSPRGNFISGLGIGLASVAADSPSFGQGEGGSIGTRQMETSNHQLSNPSHSSTANDFKPSSLLRSPVSSDMRSTINLYKKIVSDIHRLERYINGKDPFFSNGPPKQSRCIVDFINSRTSGNSILERASLSKEFVINHILSNNVLREKQYSVGQLDKIFCSQWLNHRQIIFGTKCNMLMVLDLHTSKLVQIPNLSSSNNLSSPPNTRCGIHCIAINPSRTLLAAGGENPNDIAIYKLPTLDPIGVGEGAHTDWIFDACWLDDQFLVTGSRDSTLALWRVDDNAILPITNLTNDPSAIPGQYGFLDPLVIHRFEKNDKIRALLFDNKRSEIIALSLNANLHRFNVSNFKPSSMLKLHYQNDNVCLAQEPDLNLYAVGSKTHVILVDQRHFEITSKVHTSQQGIRSLSFFSGVLTIGTGSGALLFYDIRNKKYINIRDSKEQAILKVSKGWLDPENQEQPQDIEYTPAIYTHQYDHTGTRIFTAGGPLSAGMVGNFASIWH